jgi:hypothetical protein
MDDLDPIDMFEDEKNEQTFILLRDLDDVLKEIAKGEAVSKGEASRLSRRINEFLEDYIYEPEQEPPISKN